jgi:hypothetical protein
MLFIRFERVIISYNQVYRARVRAPRARAAFAGTDCGVINGIRICLTAISVQLTLISWKRIGRACQMIGCKVRCLLYVRQHRAPHNKHKQIPMKKQMVRISILQSSKIIVAIKVLMGFLFSLIAVPMIVFGDPLIRKMGVVYLFMPVFMGIFGFVFFVIGATVYNFLAKHFGGVEVEVRDIDHA